VPVVKPTISLDPDLYAEMEEAARAEGMSFSAWVAAAGQHWLRRRRLLALAAEVLAETGGITQEQWDSAGAEMALAPSPIPPELPVASSPPAPADPPR
jgi:hypothetical protein